MTPYPKPLNFDWEFKMLHIQIARRLNLLFYLFRAEDGGKIHFYFERLHSENY